MAHWGAVFARGILRRMDVFADFRVAARGLLRSKSFAFAGAITLALGIAATTTIFSVVYGVLLRPLPYRDADRLVVIQGEKDFSTGPRMMNYSATELEEFTASAHAFTSLSLTASTGFTLRGADGVEPISGATVSGSFFDTMGTRAASRAAPRRRGRADHRHQRALLAAQVLAARAMSSGRR